MTIGFDLAEKCEKWRDRIASVFCRACGLGENFYYCFSWDEKLHQAAYKQSHKRKPIQIPDEQCDNFENQLDDASNLFDRLQSNLGGGKRNISKANKTFMVPESDRNWLPEWPW